MLGKIFVTRPIFEETLDLLRKQVQVEINAEDCVLGKPELLSRIKDVDAILPLLTDTIDREVLQTPPRLKVVANFAVGFNNIDLDAATELGIPVTNTPGVLTETTADFAWTLLMAAARRVVEGDAFTRAGKFKAWGPQMLLGYDVFGKVLGVIGLGRIGQSVARRASGFDMEVLYYDTVEIPQKVVEELRVRNASLEEIFKTSDFISLHVPLLPETHHLLNDRAFSMMKASCIVVNTSRGPVIDEKALVRALRDRRIAAAGLDVYEREPHIEPELLEMQNVVLAPHIASASKETRLKMCTMAAENLLSALQGQRPKNLVNTEVWDKRRR